MSSYPLLNVFLSMFWFFLLLLWIYLVCWIILDILRNHDISGLAKAGWVVAVVFLPLIGILLYLAFQGVRRPGSRTARRSRREAAGTASTAKPASTARTAGTASASDLSALADLHDRGVLTDAEFEREKHKALG